MRLLLDTHIALWAVTDDLQLSEAARALIVEPANEVFISVAAIWEIAIKQGLGRLNFPIDRFDAAIDGIGCRILPILPSHGLAVARLPRHHNDPFDRMLISQALLEGLTLVTRDRAIMQYEVPVFGTPDR